MPDIAGPNGRKELFEITRLFLGHTRGWGVFEDRFGRLRRRFSMDFHGRWDGPVFRLEESFRYDDGRHDERVWLISPGAGSDFTAACEDCIGIARGTATSDAIEMTYRFKLRLPSRTVAVDFRDRIYRIEDGLSVNRSTMTKWGIAIGELSLFFEHESVMSQRRHSLGAMAAE